jgi:hypothetical protein
MERSYLDETLPGQWIGQKGSVEYPQHIHQGKKRSNVPAHYAMKVYREVDVLTSALVGGEWSALLPSRFPLEKEPLVPTG